MPAALPSLCSSHQLTSRRYERVNIPHIVAQPQVTAHNMFEQSDSLGFHELIHHVAEDGADGVEALIGMAYIRQASFIQKNLLHNENRNGF
jgi:hypothetical protein